MQPLFLHAQVYIYILVYNAYTSKLSKIRLLCIAVLYSLRRNSADAISTFLWRFTYVGTKVENGWQKREQRMCRLVSVWKRSINFVLCSIKRCSCFPFHSIGHVYLALRVRAKSQCSNQLRQLGRTLRDTSEVSTATCRPESRPVVQVARVKV